MNAYLFNCRNNESYLSRTMHYIKSQDRARLRAKYPKLKKKKPARVSVNRGLNCTRQMAIDYIDEFVGPQNVGACFCNYFPRK